MRWKHILAICVIATGVMLTSATLTSAVLQNNSPDVNTLHRTVVVRSVVPSAILDAVETEDEALDALDRARRFLRYHQSSDDLDHPAARALRSNIYEIWCFRCSVKREMGWNYDQASKVTAALALGYSNTQLESVIRNTVPHQDDVASAVQQLTTFAEEKQFHLAVRRAYQLADLLLTSELPEDLADDLHAAIQAHESATKVASSAPVFSSEPTAER